MARDLHKLAQAMCSIDLADSIWIQELPRLPIPDLWLTVSRYLASLKAVLSPGMKRDGAAVAGDFGQSLEIAPDRSDYSGGNSIKGVKGADMKGNERGRVGEEEDEYLDQLTLEQIEANRGQFERTNQLVHQFMLNEGPQLQRDLKEYANKCQNWATEYWLQDMYLSNPAPLPVNSNPFFMFPRQHFASSQEMLMFATRIIQFSVDFKYRIDQQALRQDYGSGHGKGKPLCMETYKNFFHSYRMPHEDMDRLLPQSRRSNHIVVASCNQFYILRLGQDPLDNPYRKDANSQLNETIIYDQLLRIYRISREHAKRDLSTSGSSTNTTHGTIPKVGLFTTENRKVWAKFHKKLIHCNGGTVAYSNSNGANETIQSSGQASNSGSCSPNTNTESLRQIEDCLFVMCLDSLVGPKPLASTQPKHSVVELDRNDSCSSSREKENRNEVDVYSANIILTGGGTHKFTANRWFDKFLQIIVGRDGICGINIEHSASEGITVLRFLEDFLDYIKSNPIDTTSKQQQQQTITDSFCLASPLPASCITGESITSSCYTEPKSPNALLEESDKIIPLMWILDGDLKEAINEAEEKVNKLIDNFSLKILNFNYFGRTFIKNQNLSPDAFIQLALQYTFFKLHKYLVSTYESASLRQFRLGRVDNIRANTCEAYDWIQSMLLCKRSNSVYGDKWENAEASFIKAITKQVEILRYTITGCGPDNHMLALKQLAHIRYDDELPELFTDQSFKEFNNFRLSTSQLPNESGITVGYGAVVPDGYGCSYNPCKDRIIFCVSSFVDCASTSSSKFAAKLEESLLEMQELCLGRTNKTTR